MDKITVKDIDVRYKKIDTGDFICLTDIAKYKNPEDPRFIVYSWLRNKNTIVFLGLWEELHNPGFNRVEFDTVKNEAGLNSFMISPQKWIEKTGAIGLTVSSGRYNSGVYAHQDIAFEFASWVSTEFKLYFIKEFQRLKEEEQKQLGWSAKRELAKVNYRIHTDAIKENLIPAELTPLQISYVYANEADVLNVALFGMTASEWREQNPGKKGNIRDYATINELICLSNMENINAVLIQDGVPQSERVQKLNRIAISQMTPGPIGINSATYIGYNVLHGMGASEFLCVLGSFTTTLAAVLPSFIIVLALCHVYARFNHNSIFEGVMTWLRPAIIGLIGAAAVVLMTPDNFIDWTSWILFAAAFFASLVMKANPIAVIVVGGIAGFFLY